MRHLTGLLFMPATTWPSVPHFHTSGIRRWKSSEIFGPTKGRRGQDRDHWRLSRFLAEPVFSATRRLLVLTALLTFTWSAVAWASEGTESAWIGAGTFESGARDAQVPGEERAANPFSVRDLEELEPILVAPDSHFQGSPGRIFDVNGTAVFRDGASGARLYKSDGSEDGTNRIMLPDHYDSIDLRRSIVVDGRLYFLANADGGPWDFWVTDGTPDGTELFYDNSNDVIGSLNTDMFALENGLAFRDFKDSGNRLAILRENEEPIIVPGMNPGPGVLNFTVLNNQIFAAVNVDASLKQLRVIDSNGNTVASYSFELTGPGSSSIGYITAAQDRVYFSADTGYGGELYVYHAGGVAKLFDVDQEFMRRPVNMTAIGSRIYFYAQWWVEDWEDYTNNYRLATSAGSGGSTQFIWDDDSHWGITTGPNTPNLVAGNALAYPGPSNSDAGRVWRVNNPVPSGTEVITIDGNVFLQTGDNNNPRWMAIEGGAWIGEQLAGHGTNVIFTDGTSDGSVKVMDGGLNMNRMAVVDGLPWFWASIVGTAPIQRGLYRLGTPSTMHTVTTIAVNGSIDPPENPEVEHGATVIVSGVADDHHYFASVSGCDGTPQSNSDQSVSVFSYETGPVAEDCTVEAQFATLTYNLSVADVQGEGSVDVLTMQVDHGEAAEFEVTAAAGWSLSSFTGDSCTPEDNEDGTWTASNITADCAVTAVFIEDTTTALEVSRHPAIVGEAVTYSVTVTGTVSAPSDGQVELASDQDGAICSLNTPDSTSANTSTFTCQHSWAAAGSHQLTATFSGSATHGDSNGQLTQLVAADEFIFHDSYESNP